MRAVSLSGSISALEGAVVVGVVGGDDRRLVGRHLAPAAPVMVDRGRGRHAVQPRAQMLGVAQPRIGPQGAQQRVLQDVLGRVAGQPARVREQLVAVGLDEGPERWQHTRSNGRAAGTVSYRLPAEGRGPLLRGLAPAPSRWRRRPTNASTPSTTTTSRKP